MTFGNGVRDGTLFSRNTKTVADGDKYSSPCSSLVHYFHSFIHSFTAICKAHYVQNVKSEVLEAVARWSVIGKVVSF